MSDRVANYKFTEEQMLEAIKNSCGIIQNVAEKLNVDWHTAKKYINKYKTVQMAFSEESDVKMDLTENNIYKLLKEGDPVTTRWFAEKYHKMKENYNNNLKIEHEGSLDSNISITINGIDVD